MKAIYGISLFAVLLSLTLNAPVLLAQNNQPQNQLGQPSETKSDLKAELVEKDKKSKMQAATVKVNVEGIQLVDPDEAKEQPQAGQGHLHYQLDNGTIIATTAKKLSFHNLTPGKHTITVLLAANDHSPLGPKQDLEVEIK